MSEKTYNTLLNRPHITSVAEWVDIPSLPKWNRPYIRLLTIYISHYHCGSPRFHHGFSSGYDDDIQRVNAEQNNENNENKSSVDGTPTWFLSFHLRLVWGFILIERVFSRFRYMCGESTVALLWHLNYWISGYSSVSQIIFRRFRWCFSSP